MQAHQIEQRSVRELQELAEEGSRTVVLKPRRKSPSRRALLELIDILSRWSGAGLALVAGVSVYLAIAIGREYPARAAAWATMLLCALYVCRRLRGQFRAGATIAARPFRWRANYTSCASVLGAVFASAPILLLPAEAPTGAAILTGALVLLGAFGAAFFHSGHFATATAFALPAAIFPVLSGIRGGDWRLAVAFAGVAIAAMAAYTAFSRIIAANASRRNPRTRFLRKEIEGAYETQRQPESGQNVSRNAL